MNRDDPTKAPPETVLHRSDYLDLLRDLIEALLERHGGLSFGALRELANQEIVSNGIIGAAARIRALPPLEKK